MCRPTHGGRVAFPGLAPPLRKGVLLTKEAYRSSPHDVSNDLVPALLITYFVATSAAPEHSEIGDDRPRIMSQRLVLEYQS